MDKRIRCRELGKCRMGMDTKWMSRGTACSTIAMDADRPLRVVCVARRRNTALRNAVLALTVMAVLFSLAAITRKELSDGRETT